MTDATQRILEPNEIAALDHSAIPRVRIPERETVFAARAARLRKLAGPSPIGGYLRLMAAVADAQHDLLQGFEANPPERAAIEQAQHHAMPLAPAPGSALAGGRDPGWRDMLQRLLDRVEGAGLVNPSLAKLIDELRLRPAAELDKQADALLAQRFAEIEPASAPFLMATLQVVWTSLASRLSPADVPYVEQHGLCPVCGMPPVAGLVRVGGQYQGYRFLQCSLCATEWHMVRTKCSHCESTKGIAYYGIEGSSGELKAEACDECRTYRKIGYQDKDHDIEPLADDLASLALDLLMGEAGYRRASPNPLLWPELSADAGGDGRP
ncbi:MULTISPECIES: formate dehydrogenase accessory protein FdhE [Burkholderia]|uniref:formate dehydrogenase accessory protein FdhE n=1 Tax=Burkholderia TaxID=32008 RepID=UPI0008414BB0|nr:MULTISPECIES: formate dehydrogenase accessory protein FdhE [unclassified Burkholderia]AOK32173.1 formate dehydrogenase accessory protein FdhE [Burkholderia sp. Bp7605]